MPPVRGCIQATVALQNWIVSTSSKVTGSWNLHEALPHGLDFFVLLASVNGIFGNRAQANYATGNTFKDALAHYRLVHRQKAVSIDLGLMVSEGVVAQNELIALLDHYCNLSLPLLSADDAQVIVGIEMSSTVVAKGIDLHHSIRRPIFSHLFQIGPNRSQTVVDNTNTAAINRSTALKVAMSPDEAAKFLGMSSSDVEPSKPIHAYGIDSLVAVDLKNWFEREVGANVSVFDLMGNLSFRQLSALAAEQSRFRS
ncbi:hypothetical protein EYZ11_011959 [Aspergillus tanneri]|uniref:Carrier domain-containing protein n=1 Tax=Aspergillus tanneri TaxID=1220188 RepID=A0A4V3UMT9_9EURO|nr:hypothetical protein EYZ11_011959 [Aspergillus tanneri]